MCLVLMRDAFFRSAGVSESRTLHQREAKPDMPCNLSLAFNYIPMPFKRLVEKVTLAFTLMCLGLASPVASAAAYQGTVVSVFPYNGIVYMALTGGGFDGAATSCQTGINDVMLYAVDPGTSYGRILVSTALAAKVSGKLVYAVGNGVCGNGNPYNGRSYETLLGLDLKG